MDKRPIAVDLFAGAGGMSLGFEQAGFDIAAAVEIDPIHAAVHHFNFPRSSVIVRSVVGLTGEEIRAAAGIGDRAIDVVFGGPPCQGFSLIGHRALDDPRNSLVREFVRLVSELKPRAFVFENVKGLTIGRHRVFLDELIRAFRRVGYYTRVPWQVLNAKDYGVPQDRQRLFLLGAGSTSNRLSYPSPSTTDGGDLFGDPPTALTPTVKEALSDLPNADSFEELVESDEARTESWKPLSAYAKELHCETEEAWHWGYRRIWRKDMLTSSMRTAHSTISRRRFGATKEGEVEPISRFFKLSRSGQCNTLRAGTDSSRGAFTSPRPVHYRYPRCITVREMARLHGYPDWFRFHATKWHGARQVGNSVPPPLARAVAAEVIRALGVVPIKPPHKIELGDPSLLRLGMAGAAHFWNVPVPIGRRDRKSGARKRKQVDIEVENLESAGRH